MIGRALTERPELFGVAILRVAVSDAVRKETTPSGPRNVSEFGSVTTEDGFRALLEMSPYHHIKDGVRYPAVLLTHGFNDSRTAPWHSAKMAARLQAATSSGKPVLLRIDYESGHGIVTTKKQQQEEFADILSFILWQCHTWDPPS